MLDLNICSFKELIECAFGEPENNAVNFKVIQTILYLLARQLGVLDRLVQVDFVSERRPSASQSSITVSEIKIKATATNKKLKPEDVNERGIKEKIELRSEGLQTLRRLEDADRNKTQTTSVGEDVSMQSPSFDLKTEFITQGWPYNPSLDDVQRKLNAKEMPFNSQLGKYKNNDNSQELMLSTYRTITRSDEKLKITTNAYVNEKSSRFQINSAATGGKCTKGYKKNHTQSFDEKPSELTPKRRVSDAWYDEIQNQPHQGTFLKDSVSQEKEKKRENSETAKFDMSITEEVIYKENSDFSYNTNLESVKKMYINKNKESNNITASEEARLSNPGSVKHNMTENKKKAALGTMAQHEKHYPFNEAEMTKFKRQKHALVLKSPGYGIQKYSPMNETKEINPYAVPKIELQYPQTEFTGANKNYKKNFFGKEKNKDKGPEKNSLKEDLISYIDSLDDIVSINKQKEQRHRIIKKSYHNSSYKEIHYKLGGRHDKIFNNEPLKSNKTNKFYHRNKKSRYRSESEETYFKKSRPITDKYTENNKHPFEHQHYLSYSESDKYDHSERKPLYRFSSEELISEIDRPLQHRLDKNKNHLQTKEGKETFDFNKYIKLDKTSSEQLISKVGKNQKKKSEYKRSGQTKTKSETPEIKKRDNHAKIKPLYRTSSEEIYKHLEKYKDGDKTVVIDEQQVNIHSEPKKRKNSRYEQFYRSSSDEFIAKFIKDADTDTFIRGQSEPRELAPRLIDKPNDQSSKEITSKKEDHPGISINKKTTNKEHWDPMIKTKRNDDLRGNTRYESLSENNTFKINAKTQDNSEETKFGKKTGDTPLSMDEKSRKDETDKILKRDFNRNNKNIYDDVKGQIGNIINEDDRHIKYKKQNHKKYFQELTRDIVYDKQRFYSNDEDFLKLEKLRQAIMSKCNDNKTFQQREGIHTNNNSLKGLLDKKSEIYLNLKDVFLSKSPGYSGDKSEGKRIENYYRSHAKTHENPEDKSILNQDYVTKGNLDFEKNKYFKKQPGKKSSLEYTQYDENQYPSSSEEVTPKKFKQIKQNDTEVSDKTEDEVSNDRNKDTAYPYSSGKNTYQKSWQGDDMYSKGERKNTLPDKEKNKTYDTLRRKKLYRSSSEGSLPTNNEKYSGINRDIGSEKKTEIVNHNNWEYSVNSNAQYEKDDKGGPEIEEHIRHRLDKDKPLYRSSSEDLSLKQVNVFNEDILSKEESPSRKYKNIHYPKEFAKQDNYSTDKKKLAIGRSDPLEKMVGHDHSWNKPSNQSLSEEVSSDIAKDLIARKENQDNFSEKRKQSKKKYDDTEKNQSKEIFNERRVIEEISDFKYNKATRAWPLTEKNKEIPDTDETISNYEKLRQAIMSKCYGNQTDDKLPPRAFSNEAVEEYYNLKKSALSKIPSYGKDRLEKRWKKQDNTSHDRHSTPRTKNIHRLVKKTSKPKKSHFKHDHHRRDKPGYQSSSEDTINSDHEKEKEKKEKRLYLHHEPQDKEDSPRTQEKPRERSTLQKKNHHRVGEKEHYRSSSEDTITRRGARPHSDNDKSKDRYSLKTKDRYDRGKGHDHTKQDQLSSDENLKDSKRSAKNKRNDILRDKQPLQSSPEEVNRKRIIEPQTSSDSSRNKSARDRFSREGSITKDFEGREISDRTEKNKNLEEKQLYWSSSDEKITRQGKEKNGLSEYKERKKHELQRDKPQNQPSLEEIIEKRRKKLADGTDFSKDMSVEDRFNPKEIIARDLEYPETMKRSDKQDYQSSSEESITRQRAKRNKSPDKNEYGIRQITKESKYDAHEHSQDRSQYESSSESIISKEHRHKEKGSSHAEEMPIKENLEKKRTPHSGFEDLYDNKKKLKELEHSDKTHYQLISDPAISDTKINLSKNAAYGLKKPKKDESESEELMSKKHRPQIRGSDYESSTAKPLHRKNIKNRQKFPNNESNADNHRITEEERRRKNIEKERYSFSSDEEYETKKIKQMKLFNENDKLGKLKTVGGSNDTDPERVRLKRAESDEIIDASFGKRPRNVYDEELKLKLERQRDALFSKCPGFEPEAILKSDNTLSYRNLTRKKIRSDDENRDNEENKMLSRSKTKERTAKRRTRSLDSSSSDEIKKYDSQIGALFSKSPGFTKERRLPKDINDVSQSHKTKYGQTKGSYKNDVNKLPTYRSSSEEEALKTEEKQRDKSRKIKRLHSSSSEEAILKAKVKGNSYEDSKEKEAKKRHEGYDRTLEDLMLSSSEETEIAGKGRTESIEKKIHERQPTRQVHPVERTLQHREPEPLNKRPEKDLGDRHIDLSESHKLSKKTKGSSDISEEIVRDLTDSGLIHTEKDKYRFGTEDSERGDNRSGGREKEKDISDATTIGKSLKDINKVGQGKLREEGDKSKDRNNSILKKYLDKENVANTEKDNNRFGKDKTERGNSKTREKYTEKDISNDTIIGEKIKDKNKVGQGELGEEHDKSRRKTTSQEDRKKNKDKYSLDESMGSIIEEKRYKPHSERHKYPQSTKSEVDKDLTVNIKANEKKENYIVEKSIESDSKIRPKHSVDERRKQKYKAEDSHYIKEDKKNDESTNLSKIRKEHSSDESFHSKSEPERKKGMTSDSFQEKRQTIEKYQPSSNEDRTDILKSDNDSADPKQSKDKKKEKTIRNTEEIAHKDGKVYSDTKLGETKDFVRLSDSKSSDSLNYSIKTKDTENKKDADSKKDSIKDNKMAKLHDFDKQKDLDDFKDSKTLDNSAKLAKKPGDSKQYDEDEGSHGRYEDKARKQSIAISDGTKDDYAVHAKSDLPPGGHKTDTKGGKKLDLHGVPLEVFEELREQELRVIDQRADSREEPDREPTRMLSVPSAENALAHSTKEGQKGKADAELAPGKLGKRTSSTGSRKVSQDIEAEKKEALAGKRTSSTGSRRPSQDIEEEKVLVVERIPLDKEKAREYKEKHKDTPLAVVRLEEFEALVTEVKELEARIRPASRFSFPGNAELLEHIRNGASLTEAMAALQLSARIEAAENALENIIEMVSKLAAQNPDVDIDKYGQPIVKTSLKREETKPMDYLGLDQYPGGVGLPQKEGGAKCREGCITKPEFDSEILKVQKELAKEIGECAKKNLSKIDVLAKNLRHLESKVEDAVHMSNRISDLEDSVSSYSERINAMDTGLSVQMTSYQDQLTQMQHELEEGLENMAETLANAEGDPAAVAELHAKLNILQDDLVNTSNIQSELEKNEHDVFVNLKDLFTQIEHLRETKADREEVEDALQNKAGLSALNGLISLEHFDALLGDMEANIGKAYDKFNNQELIWQKAINDLVKELNEKTNLEIVLNLRDDINNKLNMMTERITSLRDIVGEPKAFGVSKRINVGAECLSCKTPAQMEPEAKPSRMPAIKSPSASAGGAKMKEVGDACYPGHPFPHSLDPRTHICNRYCGGSHTVLKNVARAKSLPGALSIKKWERPIKTEAGTDGKAYLVEDFNARGPCKPCNIRPSVSTIEISPKPSPPVKGKAVFEIDIGECDKCPCFNVEPELDSDVTLTG